ncbi:MAG: TIGR03086 family metal-binding protein [Nocardioidaceae bacterium]
MEHTNELLDLHQRALDRFGANVRQVRDDQWDSPTPCDDWDVRTLVNHVVNENRWTPPLLEGQTIAEVGDRFDGDLLGADPKHSWDDSAQQAAAAVHADGALDRIVHLSFGDAPGGEYVWQLFADVLVHGWDLASAIGTETRLDPELVEACAQWFAGVEEDYRSAGAIGPRPEVAADADAQTRLLAAFGRASKWG